MDSQNEEQEPKLEFIEIRRVISDKQTRMNVGSQREAIPVAEIHTFRAWHKGKNDGYIKGEMTQVLLKPKKRKKDEKIAVMEGGKVSERVNPRKDKPRVILIEESYSSFLFRMSHHVPVRVLPPELTGDDAL